MLFCVENLSVSCRKSFTFIHHCYIFSDGNITVIVLRKLMGTHQFDFNALNFEGDCFALIGRWVKWLRLRNIAGGLCFAGGRVKQRRNGRDTYLQCSGHLLFVLLPVNLGDRWFWFWSCTAKIHLRNLRSASATNILSIDSWAYSHAD